MKKVLKVLSEICKWLTLFPKILELLEAVSRDNNKNDSNSNNNNNN